MSLQHPLPVLLLASIFSPGNLLELPVLGLFSRPTESETPGLGPRHLCSNKPSRWFSFMLKFDKHWLRGRNVSGVILPNSGETLLKTRATEQTQLSVTESERAPKTPFESLRLAQQLYHSVTWTSKFFLFQFELDFHHWQPNKFWLSKGTFFPSYASKWGDSHWALVLWSLKCGSEISRISITREFVKNSLSDLQIRVLGMEPSNLCCNKPSMWSWCSLKFKNH